MSGHDDPDPAGAGGGESTDEMKRRFREALEKKNAAQHEGTAHLDGRGAVREPHGRAGAKRAFRRKSG